MNVNLTLLKRALFALTLLVAFGLAIAPHSDNMQPQVANAQGGGRGEVRIDPELAAMLEVDEVAQAILDEEVAVMVVFDGPAVAEIDPTLSTEAFTQAERATDSTVQAIENAGFDIAYRHTLLINAVQIRTRRGNIPQLMNIPGIKSVEVIPVLEAHNASSVPFINADDWWAATGNAGAGTTVAVIDSGVNYNHANFGRCTLNRGVNGVLNDPADPPSLANGFGDETYNGALCKVVGGIDFYSGDDDPMGCNPTNVPAANDDGGHGTHVAGSAVGYGVAAGTTYTGPYDATTYSSTTFDIGPGVAPEANLLAVRVLGCIGSTAGSFVPDPVTAGIEWAVQNFADVINMSLGSSFNGGYYETVIENATNAGTIVVASAGNSGDAHYITGAPSGASTAISVAASDDRSGFYDAEVDVNSPASIATTIGFLNVGISADGPQVPVSGITRDVATTTPLDGCSAIAENLTGKIALIQRGGCPFSDKIVNAQNANADAVIIWNATNGGFVNTMSAPGAAVPAVFIGFADGQTIEDEILVNGNTVNVTLRGVSVDNSYTLASFSSRGPRRAQHGYDVVLKPDIAAPGASITSSVVSDSTVSSVTAERPNGEDYLGFAADGYPAAPPDDPFDPLASATYGGTSMSSPHIAGVMALLKAEYGGLLSPIEYKALAMNNTVNLYTISGPSGIQWGPSRVGAGNIEFAKLLQNRVAPNQLYAIAYNTANPELVSVSWGNVEVVNTVNESRSITVENFTASSITYNISYDAANDMAGVTFTVPSSITVPALGTANFNVTLTATAASMTTPNAQDPASLQLLNDGYHWLTEEGGYVELTPNAGGSVLRVPVYALVRIAADMQAVDNVTLPDTYGSSSIALSGTDIFTGGSFPNDVTSLLVPFELAAVDPVGDIPAPPTVDYSIPAADIEYVGVTANNDVVYFGLNTAGEWSVPNEVSLEVNISTCQDGFVDFVLFNSRGETGAEDNKIWSFIDVYDVYGFGAGTALTINAPINEIAPTSLTTYVFNNDSMVLPAPVSFFDVYPSCRDGIWDFWIETYDNYDFGILHDTVGSSASPLSYNYGNQTYSFTPDIGGVDIPVIFDWNGTSFNFNYDVVGLSAPLPDILLLHLHNANNTAEIVDVELDPAFVPYGTESFVIGDWTTDPFTGAVDNDLFCTSDEVAEVAYEITTDGFDIVHYRQPGGGRYEVDVDGTIVRTVDTNGTAGFVTENFSGYGAGYHRVKVSVIDSPTGPVCIDAFIGDASPTLIPSNQPIFQTHYRGVGSFSSGLDTGQTNAIGTCGQNLARVHLETFLDGLSSTYEISALFISSGQYYLSQRFSFPGLGSALELPIAVIYHDSVALGDPIIPGYPVVSAPPPSALTSDTQIIVQLRDENGVCETVSVEYNCTNGQAFITQNDSVCVFN